MTPRDWTLARAKVNGEGACRYCNVPASEAPLDPAHVIPRSLGGSPQPIVLPEEIVPLCRECHRDYDDHRLDLLPHLTRPEQAAAVLRVGLMGTLRQVTGHRCWSPA